MPFETSRYIAAVIAVAISCMASASAETFPYSARITSAGAAVLSGPGAQYYSTAELPAGATVQVFQHTPGGYCAIRPPEGSFSWIPASDAQRLGDGVARVTRKNAPARVGSLLHDRRDVVHVRLNQGERLRVLSETEVDGVKWLQVSPPSGEFRWVKRELLTSVVEDVPANRGEATSDSGWVRAAAHTEQPATDPPVEITPTPPGPVAKVTGAQPVPEATPTAPPALPLKLEGTFAQKLMALDVALSRQVSELPTLWRLTPIEQQAAALLAEAPGEAERAAVRQFAVRVDRFAAIANRYKATRGLAPKVALTKSTIPRVTPLAAAGVPATPVDTSDYDAVGVLRPVVSKRANAPQYALVNESGKIVTFITAPPELKLAPLVGTRIGVQGAKGFMPEYQHQHVTARRVASVGGSTLRR